MSSFSVLVLVVVGVMLSGMSGMPGGSSVSAVSAVSSIPWLSFNGGGSRSGINSAESLITLSNVGTLSLLWSIALPLNQTYNDDTIDSSPLFYPNVSVSVDGTTRDLIFAHAVRGTLFAIDANTGSIVWSVPDTSSCLTDDCITKSTPVLNVESTGVYIYNYHLDGSVRKYDIRTGAEVSAPGFPVTTTLSPSYEQGSSPLNIFDDVLYITTSGDNHDDAWYDGHVIAVNLTDGTTNIWNSLCSTKRYLLTEQDCPITDRNGAGIWSRASTTREPRDGSLYVAMGNGLFNGNSGGDYYADSIVRLRPGLPNVDGQNVILDSYTPSDYLNMQTKDYDLGSSGPCILPEVVGSSTPFMLVQASKDAILRLINRDNMSGAGCCGHVGGEVHQVSYTDGFVFTHPLSWQDPSTNVVWVFVTSTTAATKKIGFHAYTIVTDGAGHSTLNLNYTLTNTGSSPFVANNILFYQVANSIHAIQPTTGKLLWQSSKTQGVHWQSPIVLNGRVYTGDDSGNFYAWGL